MTSVPPDWVLLEAGKRCKKSEDIVGLRAKYQITDTFRALCDALLEPAIQPPVDRKLLCAREAISHGSPTLAEAAAEREINHCIRAIELWESGYGA